MNICKSSLVIGGIALGLGCGGATLPTNQLASTEASVRSAEELGAQNVPDAQLHLRLAKEELDAAHKAADKGDGDRATRLLLRARSDADLALALSREANAHQELQQMSSSNRVNSPETAAQAER